MKKLLKIAAALFAVAALAAIAAVVVIRVKFPPEKIKALIVEKAEATLKRKVEVGDVGFGLFTGLRVAGVRISEKPDFSKGDFLKAKEFRFSFRWMPLLDKKLVANEVALEGLEVTVKKHKDGTNNIPNLEAATKSNGTTLPPQPSSRKREEGAAGPADAGIAVAAVTVETIKLKDAQIRYIDEKEKSEALVKVPLAAISRFTLDGEFPFTAKVELGYKSGKDARTALIDAAGTLDLAAGKMDRVKADVAKLSVKTSGVEVKGSLQFENADKPKVEGTFTTPALDAKTLASLASGVPAGTDLPAATFKFSAKMDGDTLALPAFSLDAGILQLSGGLSKTGDVLDLKNVSAAFGGAKARVSGRVSGLSGGDPALALKLETDTIAFDAFAKYLPDIQNLKGRAKLAATVGGKVSAPRVAGNLDLADAGAEYMKQKLEGFTGTVRFSESAVDMPRLTGKVNGGDLVLRLSVTDPKAPVILLNGSLSALDAGALEALMSKTPDGADASTPLSTSAAPPPYTGPVARTTGAFTIEKISHPNFTSAKAVLDWDLNGVTPELKLLTGKATLRIGAGRAVKLLEMARKKGGISRSMVLPLELLAKARGKIPGLNIPDMNDLKFDKIEGDYVFNKGVMTMQPSLIDGPDLKAQTRGTVDLVKQVVDLKSSIAASGIGSMTLLITGPADDPKIVPDLTKAKEEIKERGTKILKEQGQKLLKGLFNK